MVCGVDDDPAGEIRRVAVGDAGGRIAHHARDLAGIDTHIHVRHAKLQWLHLDIPGVVFVEGAGIVQVEAAAETLGDGCDPWWRQQALEVEASVGLTDDVQVGVVEVDGADGSSWDQAPAQH